MSNYILKKVYLSEGQKNKLKSAYKKDEEISLQIDKTKTSNHDMYLTKTQIKQIENGKRINISKTQLKKNGGFLPFLLPILAALGTGALSGTAAWGANKILNKVTGAGCKKKKNLEREFFRITRYIQ